MAFISVFDVLGPNMIGPSSSHTAGACSIALLAQKMISGPVADVEFTLYGSFARTYRGNGTDRALLGGIMGFSTADKRIPDSFSIAESRGLSWHFIVNEREEDVHPNTVDIRMTGKDGQVLTVRGESLGGGKVRITRINQVDVDFSGEYSTLIVIHYDKPGLVAHITKCLSDRDVNIAFMKMFREAKGQTAYSIVSPTAIFRRISPAGSGKTLMSVMSCWFRRRWMMEKQKMGKKKNSGGVIWILKMEQSCWPSAGNTAALFLR